MLKVSTQPGFHRSKPKTPSKADASKSEQQQVLLQPVPSGSMALSLPYKRKAEATCYGILEAHMSGGEKLLLLFRGFILLIAIQHPEWCWASHCTAWWAPSPWYSASSARAQLVQQARGSRLCRAQKTFLSPQFPARRSASFAEPSPWGRRNAQPRESCAGCSLPQPEPWGAEAASQCLSDALVKGGRKLSEDVVKAHTKEWAERRKKHTHICNWFNCINKL